MEQTSDKNIFEKILNFLKFLVTLEINKTKNNFSDKDTTVSNSDKLIKEDIDKIERIYLPEVLDEMKRKEPKAIHDDILGSVKFYKQRANLAIFLIVSIIASSILLFVFADIIVGSGFRKPIVVQTLNDSTFCKIFSDIKKLNDSLDSALKKIGDKKTEKKATIDNSTGLKDRSNIYNTNIFSPGSKDSIRLKYPEKYINFLNNLVNNRDRKIWQIETLIRKLSNNYRKVDSLDLQQLKQVETELENINKTYENFSQEINNPIP